MFWKTMKSRSLGPVPIGVSLMTSSAGLRRPIPPPFHHILPPHLRVTALIRNFCGTVHTHAYSYLPMTSRMFLDSITRTLVSRNATAEFLDVADSSFNSPSGHQDPTEGVSLPASCPLRFGPTFDGRDPSPTEGPAFPSASRHFEGTLVPSASDLQPPPSLHRSIELDRLYFSQILPQTFSAETNVTRDTSRVFVPPTRPLSWARSHSGESCGNETFSATMAIRVSTRDSGTATTPLGTTTTFLPSPSQEVLSCTYSAVHLPDSTLNDYIPLDPYFTHDEAAPSFGHQVRRFANTVAFTPPSSRVSARRNSKKYLCNITRCSSGFAQRQGLNRHVKDIHARRIPCPYCSDFEWSEGRLYLFKSHLRKMHPGAPLPRSRNDKTRALK
ncbi:hypothetical protein EDB85DRAFT_1274761 [Lactarius pseudohatsudake]|nr:hypothetical protein EDB85DRAFT_1274761 [Lactarius pseudohatsudake]